MLDLAYDSNDHLEDFIDKIYQLVRIQLKMDVNEYDRSIAENDKPKISLLAKYIPKEDKYFDRKYHFVDNFLGIDPQDINSNSANERRKMYRKCVSTLNKSLDTIEIKMSAQKFADINFEKITSKSAFKYRKAFLNICIEQNIEDYSQR